MSDVSSDTIEYRTTCKLSDLLKLQSRCSLYALRYLWVIFLVLCLVLIAVNGGSITSILDDPWSVLGVPLLCGLLAGFGFGPIVILVRWALGKIPKEIRADINDGGIKVIGEDFNYEAKWPNMSWVREGPSAYVLKFKRLFIRLPKREFTPEQEAGFRKIIHAQAPASGNRLKS